MKQVEPKHKSIATAIDIMISKLFGSNARFILILSEQDDNGHIALTTLSSLAPDPMHEALEAILTSVDADEIPDKKRH